MKPKITSLSDEQIAKFPQYVERWTKIGLCTDPADRPRAEAGIAAAYAAARLPPPRVVWCGSPLGNALTRAAITDDGKEVRDSVRDSVLVSVWASVRDSVGASVRASVGASVRASVGASVGDSVWASVLASVLDSVGASVGDSVRASVWASVLASGFGQHDANWLAFYRFFRDECGLVAETESLYGLWEICQSAGWFLPHEKICWVSERHNILSRDDRGRLHCEDGPALAYPDGWCLWRINGVAVDEQIVLRPQSQTVEQIRGEKNEEVKRIRIERFGWDKYLKKVGAEVVSRRRNDVEGTKEALMRTPDGMVVLVCACPSTARVYALEVPTQITTCEAAQDYLWSGSNLLAGRKLNVIGRT